MVIPASLLILLVPIVAAIPAYFLRRWRAVEIFIAAIACGAIIVMLSRPMDSVLNLGAFSIDRHASINILGRVLALRMSDHLPLLLLFITALVIFLLGLTVAQGWTFIPLGLFILALVSAGLMIRPFIYAALAFEAAAAVAAIMIQAEHSGKDSTRGALRYLIISTLALPAFLGAGYAITMAGGITDPALQATAYSPASILLGIGLAVMIGALPIFTWTHSVATDAPPLTTAFLATIGTGAVTFLFLSLKQDYDWFNTSTDVASLCRFFGIGSILFGGLLGWAQRSFGRVIACGLSVEIGCTLLLMNHSNALSVEAVAFGIGARALSVGVMGIGIGIIREHSGSDEFTRIGGMGKQHLWAALAIAIGGLSLAGLPGTLGFVSRWATARVLGQTDLEILVLSMAAGASVGAGVIRGMAAIFKPTLPIVGVETDSVDALSGSDAESSGRHSDTGRHVLARHKRYQAVTIAMAVGLVILIGLVPGVTAPVTKGIAQNYTFYDK